MIAATFLPANVPNITLVLHATCRQINSSHFSPTHSLRRRRIHQSESVITWKVATSAAHSHVEDQEELLVKWSNHWVPEQSEQVRKFFTISTKKYLKIEAF